MGLRGHAGGGPASAGDAHLGGPGCWGNRHPVTGQREEGKEPAPDPAAESEKLIIARRPEMHPMVIEPSGRSPLGKEAAARLPGHTVQTWVWLVHTFLMAPGAGGWEGL